MINLSFDEVYENLRDLEGEYREYKEHFRRSLCQIVALTAKDDEHELQLSYLADKIKVLLDGDMIALDRPNEFQYAYLMSKTGDE